MTTNRHHKHQENQRKQDGTVFKAVLASRRLYLIEPSHEAKIHVQLLVTVKQREWRTVCVKSTPLPDSRLPPPHPS
jgi:hypothetical protein